MSVICGIYHLDGKPVTDMGKMMEAFNNYKFDRSNVWQVKNIFLGSRLQMITPEDQEEKLPYYDSEADLVITADAIIDNRKELFNLLDIPYSQQMMMPDSLLILKAYKRWGEECPHYLIGDFAFAIWDKSEQKLFCARDQVGKRILYYYYSSKVFAFSTLIKPLLEVSGIETSLSEAWIADFLANPTVISQVDPEITPYKNICMLLPGHTLTITAEGKKLQEYWKVEPWKQLNLKSDSEYEEAFREVLFEAVKCRMRSNRPVGVLLSGGLDSSSIACVAEQYASAKGNHIKGFTSIPMEGYQDWTSQNALADETSFVQELYHHNGIETIYGRADGRHALNTTRKISNILEQPYKYFENAVWIDYLLEEASQQHNIGVMLNGQSGNSTISWGIPQVYFNSLLRNLKIGDLCRETAAWGQARGNLTSSILLRTAKNLIPLSAYKYWWCFTGKKDPAMKKSIINPTLAKKIGFPERFYQFGGDPYAMPITNSFRAREIMNCHNVFNQVGILEKKMSLAYNIAMRDPSRDKRVIEFCFSVPDSQYVRMGQDRFLLRRAMEGILPDKIRLNSTVRGKQGVDWLQRIEPYWQEMEKELSQLFEQDYMKYYLDVPQLQAILKNLDKNAFHKSPSLEHHMLVSSLIFGRFMGAYR